MSTRANATISALARDLADAVRGEVDFSDAARTLYATDASHYRQTPIGVVMPRDAEDVVAAMAVCRRHDVPVLGRGGGTSLAGQGCNAAVVFDHSRDFNRVLEIAPRRRLARVEPGCVLDTLRGAAEAHGLTFGPDPSTHAWCTLGGMIGNNACGVHSVMAGKTVDNVESLEVLTWDGVRMRVGPTGEAELARRIAAGGREGEIYAGLRAIRDRAEAAVRREFPDIPRRVSGYNLDELLPERGFHVARALVGTEGTCVTILEATLRLVRSPPYRTLVLVGYPDLGAAGDEVVHHLGFEPIGLEGMDRFLVENMRAKGLEAEGTGLLPEGNAWLFVEFGGESQAEADARAAELTGALAARAAPPPVRVLPDRAEAAKIWKTRESGLGASARLADGTITEEGWEDSAVPPARLGDYLRDFEALVARHGYRCTYYGHFGQGLVHCRIDFDLRSAEGIARYRAFVEAGAELVVAYGGSLSGEHGDGQSRAELLSRMYSRSILEAFEQFKALFDPAGRMNPGKVVRPARLDENLKHGPDFHLPQLETAFAYPEDAGGFGRALTRCIGVGKCRRGHGEGLMCPSYQVTGEEKHATRGRARLLWEMVEGRLAGGWRSEAVREALDLCLACKGCKSDCPAGVDVATYKAEFLHHHYRGRWRPRAAYAFGLIHHWAKIGRRLPGLVNFLNRAPGVSGLTRRLAGMAPGREAPAFARRSFRDRARWPGVTGAGAPGSRRVVLWPDTFNDHFHPEVLEAGARVLASAGWEVEVPRARVCCGRPLYDFGMLRAARRQLAGCLEALGPAIRAGWPVVGLEPSCVAVFRDELVNLMPEDPAARRLSQQVMTLAEFLADRAPDYRPPRVGGEVLFHGHCHQKALGGTAPDVAILEAAGARVSAPESGCCGMAGSFGFKAEHYAVSVAVGEQALLPAVRALGPGAKIVADGFSCREQVRQLTGREPMHLAEFLVRSS